MKARLTEAAAALTTLFCLLFAHAVPAESAHEPVQQRQAFLAAEKALKERDFKRYATLKASLKDYPLYPYLEFDAINQDLSYRSSALVEGFLTRHADSPLASRLRGRWLDLLAKEKRWHAYLAFYSPYSSVERRCDHLNALIESGKRSEAFEQVEPLWLSGLSQPDQCDPVFDAWRKAGHLTQNLVWQRIELAMDKNQLKLARYLERFLGKDDKPWLDRWLAIHEKPQRIFEAKLFASDHPMRSTVLSYGMRKLAYQDTENAAGRWKKLSSSYAFNQSQVARIERTIALAMNSGDHPDALDAFSGIEPDKDDIYLHEKRIRAALEQRSWSKALAWLEALPSSAAQTLGWRYWRARALEQNGYAEDAKPLYQDLSHDRSYYGFLAADRLQNQYHLGHKPLQTDQDLIAQLAERIGFRRSFELKRLGRSKDALREWHYATRGLTKTELRNAAKLADQWSWHDQAIATVARASEWDDLVLRFPLAFQKTIEQQARHNQLDVPWVFALLRQESAFAPDALSSAGAMGLMQLMPATARFVAGKLNQPKPHGSEIINPDFNIRLGTAYLSGLLEQNYDNMILATASYNAGPHRVKRWLPDTDMPADIWVEIIPFNETRNYVQRILSYTVIYEQRLGIPLTRLAERMPDIGPKSSLLSQRQRPRKETGS